MNRHIPYITLIVILIVYLFALKQCSAKKEALLTLQQQVLSDSLVVTTNKVGQQTAEIGLIQTNFQTFKDLHLAKEDSLGKELQKLVTRGTISATIATTVMRVDTVVKTDSVLYASNGCDSAYILNDTTQYRTLNITASKDSFNVKFRAFERLEFVQSFSKWNLFKKQTATTSFKNFNPDVEITGLRTYTTECDCKKKVWLGFVGGNITGTAIGVGIGYVAGKLK